MKPTKVIVDKVVAFEDTGGTSDATVRFGDGAVCRVPRSDPQFPRYSRLLREEQAEGRIVYVECDSASGSIRDLAVTALRRIDTVAAEPADDRLDVQIRMSPSRHFVRTTHPNFEDMRRCLLEAAASKGPVLITVAAGSTEIIDARRPPQGYSRPVI